MPYFPRDGGLRSRSWAEYYGEGQVRAQGICSSPKCFPVQPAWERKNLALRVGLVLQHPWEVKCFPWFTSQQPSYKATGCWIPQAQPGWDQSRDVLRGLLGSRLMGGLNGADAGSWCLAGLWPKGAKPPMPAVLVQRVPSLHGSGQALVSCRSTAGKFQGRTGSSF